MLIDANASDKSNLVQLLRFMRDIATLGVDNAVSIQGGRGFVATLQIDFQIPLSIKVQLEEDAIGTALANRVVDTLSDCLIIGSFMSSP